MHIFKLIKLTIKWILKLLVPPGREEGPDHCADRCPASIRHPCWGHQPLHGHLQEDGWRVRRPLCLLLHLHHLARDPAARWLRDSLMDQEDLFNLASLFQRPLLMSPIATRQGHLRWLTLCCRRQSVKRILAALSSGKICVSAGRVLINSVLQDSTKFEHHVSSEFRVCYRSSSHSFFFLHWSWETEKCFIVRKMYSGIDRAEWYYYVRSSTENGKCRI